MAYKMDREAIQRAILTALIQSLQSKTDVIQVTPETLCNEFKFGNSDINSTIHAVEEELYIKGIVVKIPVPSINEFNVYSIEEFAEELAKVVTQDL